MSNKTKTFVVEIDPERCKACGYCKHECPRDVFEETKELNAGGYHPMSVERPGNCIGCLTCLMICPDFAITVNEESSSR
ncbi:MAG: 2-oxoglutarate ferredoxin oxidoreductase subunit delta [Desulfovibrionales bacterium]|jgi:NAD-dependent dihydropyrimidine dehydrogenase PreA subunit|nr:2-oxoglutarate ferredoxin oxidoreductase subunit delta [Desulfovibrionales bacterium]